MSDTVAGEVLDLLTLAGLTPADIATFPLQRAIGSRTNSGDVDLEVQQGECLVITFIETFNVDMSASPTMAVTTSNHTVAYPARPLASVFEVPTLYAFPPCNFARFSFSVTALPGTDPELRVSGYILPQKALDILSRLNIRETITP